MTDTEPILKYPNAHPVPTPVVLGPRSQVFKGTQLTRKTAGRLVKSLFPQVLFFCLDIFIWDVDGCVLLLGGRD